MISPYLSHSRQMLCLFPLIPLSLEMQVHEQPDHGNENASQPEERG